MSRLTILLLLLAILPLAGCTGASEPPLEAAGEDVGPQHNESAGAPVEVEPTPDETADNGESPANEPVGTQRVITPVDWDGTSGTSVCVPGGAGWCERHSIEDADVDLQFALSGIIGTNLTLTWESVAPPFDTMTLIVSSGISCGEYCYQYNGTESHFVSGTSPLSLSVDHDMVSDTILNIVVSPSGVDAPSPLFASAEVRQAFHLAGTLTSIK